MSIVHKFSGSGSTFSWESVDAEAISDKGLKNITKHVVIGEKEGAPHFFMRYFHVEPHGHSRLERHPQEHEVIVLHGQGQVKIAGDTFDISPFDVVFIEGNELHQFLNTGEQPLGFICVIPKNV